MWPAADNNKAKTSIGKPSKATAATGMCIHACLCVCVRACVRACVRVCVRACVRTCMRAACVRACVLVSCSSQLHKLTACVLDLCEYT